MSGSQCGYGAFINSLSSSRGAGRIADTAGGKRPGSPRCRTTVTATAPMAAAPPASTNPVDRLRRWRMGNSRKRYVSTANRKLNRIAATR